MNVLDGLKRCGRCGTLKSPEDFTKDCSREDGRFPWCRVCKKEASVGYYQDWNPEQRERHRQRVLRYRYGLSHEMLMLLYEEQEGCCAICGTAGDPPAVNEKGRRKGVLHVDHDHQSKRVRGLLCFNCNGGLGQFKDDVARLIRAAAYLIKEES